MATPQRSCTFSLRRPRAAEKDSPTVDTVTIDTADAATVDTVTIDTVDFHAYTAGDRRQYIRGSPPLPVSTKPAAKIAAELAAESPTTPHIGDTEHMSTRERITSLKEQRQALQQRAHNIRATTGTPYSSEVHLLLGQSYLDPASWQELIASSGVRAAARRAQFARRYRHLLARLEAAIEQYEQHSAAQNSPGAERMP